MVLVQHAGTGGASSGCPLSKEELTVTCRSSAAQTATAINILEIVSKSQYLGYYWKELDIQYDISQAKFLHLLFCTSAHFLIRYKYMVHQEAANA